MQFRRDGTGSTTVTDADASRIHTSNVGDVNGVEIEPLVAKGRHEEHRDATSKDINYILGVCPFADGSAAICIDVEERNGGTNFGVVGITPLSDGVWHIATASYDGRTLKLFLGGIPQGTVNNLNGIRNDAAAKTSIGSAVDSEGVPDGFFNGGIGYVGI
eukprot:SAG31_NODE_15994_length_728_cov_0.799682_1_plen_159_part_01